jgi:hypothetical protein
MKFSKEYHTWPSKTLKNVQHPEPCKNCNSNYIEVSSHFEWVYIRKHIAIMLMRMLENATLICGGSQCK